MTRRTRVVVASSLVLVGVAAALVLRSTGASGDGSEWGDIGGPRVCDARAVMERRPQVDRIGCFVHVPGGRFLMGAQASDPSAPAFDPDAAPDEGPPRALEVPEFFLQKEEVSVQQFDACVKAGACRSDDVLSGEGYLNFGSARRLHPVNGVSWLGAQHYCAWVGGRLPSEVEWEFAARGQDGRRFAWGADAPDCNHAIMRDARGAGCGRGGTVQVNDHPKVDETVHMLLHQAGNVWEWTADWYAEDWYARAPAGSRDGPLAGERRVQRGGGWTDEPAELRSSARGALEPESRMDDVGFRCAMDRKAFSRRELARLESFSPSR